jgi:indolepyruvate ferredoxin oxidoreductase alpha subunit
MALAAKVPVFDPSSPEEARAMVRSAFSLSEQFDIPTMLRPTTRVCHALQGVAFDTELTINGSPPKARFKKDPVHWTATPKLRHRLHIELNEKLRQIEQYFELSELNSVVGEGTSSKIGIIASGVAFETARQALAELGASIPMLKIGTPFPLPLALVSRFIDSVELVVVLEEPDACIELQLPQNRPVRGRRNDFVPGAGELSPEVVSAVLAEALDSAGIAVNPPADDPRLQEIVDSLELPVRGPRLCPGCSHRSAFFALKREFGPRAIYPGDIGCYTLGMNLRAVDTFVDMGAAVSMADGLFQAGQLTGDSRPIIASIGDSTFLHSGIVPLINAVHTGSRFVLIILDNRTTAMTGFQPTAEADHLADGSQAGARASIPDLVRACGVDFVEVTDPYDQESFQRIVRNAYDHSQAPEGGVAVVIADRPCVLDDPLSVQEQPIPVVVTEECDGCRYCTEAFECPALVLRPDGSRVDIDRKTCIDCGQCIDACYKGFILPEVMA